MTASITNLPAVMREQWVERIAKAWRRTTESIIETGTIIADAKRGLPHGEFLKMVGDELPFSRQVAHRLMTVARNAVLSNVDSIPHLPPSWSALYELSKLDPPTLVAKIKDGTVNPKTTRRDVMAWRKQPPPGEATPMDQPTATPPKLSGPVFRVPVGKTVSGMCREGIELERTGTPSDDAAKAIGIGAAHYRQARTIVRLADMELNPADAETVRRACALMDETKRSKAAYEMVRPIVEQVWGRGRRRRDEQVAQRRVESFKTALAIIVEACTRGRDIDVPPLTQQDAESAIEQVGEASTALKAIAANIKRVDHGRANL